MIRTINNVIRTVLIQAHLPCTYWVEALLHASHLINLLPSKAISNKTLHLLLHGKQPTYDHLRVFGCLCYPNLLAVTPNELLPRSTRCVFLGYPSQHRGYKCFDLKSNKVIISRHVTFDESQFPYVDNKQHSETTYDFLSNFEETPPSYNTPFSSSLPRHPLLETQLQTAPPQLQTVPLPL